MKVIRKVVLFALCVVLIISVMGCGSTQNDKEEFEFDNTPQFNDTIDGILYNIYGNYAAVASYNGNEVNVVIPETIETTQPKEKETYPVLVIEDKAFTEDIYDNENSVKIQSIKLPQGLMKIGDNAFEDCVELKEINIPDSVSVMGKSIFDGCTQLSTVNIPPMIKTIPSGFCSGCTNLTSIIFSEGTEEYPLATGRVIGSSAFSECQSLTELVIPKEFVKIESMVFNECTNLKSITIPESVSKIADDAFYNPPEDFVIYGVRKSEAAKYCMDNMINFKLLEEKEKDAAKSEKTE